MSDLKIFNRDYETNEILPKPLGRLRLASGNIVRLVFTPDGLKLAFDKVCITNGDVFLYDFPESLYGLAAMPEKKKT